MFCMFPLTLNKLLNKNMKRTRNPPTMIMIYIWVFWGVLFLRTLAVFLLGFSWTTFHLTLITLMIIAKYKILQEQKLFDYSRFPKLFSLKKDPCGCPCCAPPSLWICPHSLLSSSPLIPLVSAAAACICLPLPIWVAVMPPSIREKKHSSNPSSPIKVPCSTLCLHANIF